MEEPLSNNEMGFIFDGGWLESWKSSNCLL